MYSRNVKITCNHNIDFNIREVAMPDEYLISDQVDVYLANA